MENLWIGRASESLRRSDWAFTSPTLSGLLAPCSSSSPYSLASSCFDISYHCYSSSVCVCFIWLLLWLLKLLLGLSLYLLVVFLFVRRLLCLYCILFNTGFVICCCGCFLLLLLLFLVVIAPLLIITYLFIVSIGFVHSFFFFFLPFCFFSLSFVFCLLVAGGSERDSRASLGRVETKQTPPTCRVTVTAERWFCLVCVFSYLEAAMLFLFGICYGFLAKDYMLYFPARNYKLS